MACLEESPAAALGGLAATSLRTLKTRQTLRIAQNASLGRSGPVSQLSPPGDAKRPGQHALRPAGSRQGQRALGRRSLSASSQRAGPRAATVNVWTQEAIEVLAVCLYHKEKLILESHTLFFKSLIPDSCFVLSGTHQWYP